MDDKTAPYRTPSGARETARDDATWALPKEPVGPPKIEGYTISGRLGEGGMGAVFLAKDDVLGRSVAIKVISQSGNDALAEARFLREARSMAAAEHPNIVRVISFGTTEGKPYLIMELVDGESLSERLQRVNRLSVTDAMKIVRPVVEALAASWQKGLIHRDIKPSNILIDKKGVVRVADFGLAKPAEGGGVDNELTQTGAVVGSPYYMAPEQATGQPCDFRADIYSLGVVLYEMLSGERPFTGANALSIIAKHLQAPMPSLRTKRPDIPPLAATIVERMTMKEPQKRYASYGLLLRDIDRILSESAPTAVSLPATSRVASAPAASGSNKWLVAMLAGAVIVMAVLLLARRSTPTKSETAVSTAAKSTEAGTSVTVTSAPAQTESASSFTFPTGAYTPPQQPAAPQVQPIAQQQQQQVPQQQVQPQPQYQPPPPPPPMGGPPPGGPGMGGPPPPRP